MLIDPVISGYIPSIVSILLHICDHLVISFGEKSFCLGFSNTYHVDSLDRFSKVFVEKVHNAMDTLKGGRGFSIK